MIASEPQPMPEAGGYGHPSFVRGAPQMGRGESPRRNLITANCGVEPLAEVRGALMNN